MKTKLFNFRMITVFAISGLATLMSFSAATDTMNMDQGNTRRLSLMPKSACVKPKYRVLVWVLSKTARLSSRVDLGRVT